MLHQVCIFHDNAIKFMIQIYSKGTEHWAVRTPQQALRTFSLLFQILCDILQPYIFLEEMANKDNVKSLRKDKDELKKQLQELT